MPVIYYFNEKYEHLVPKQDLFSLMDGRRILIFNSKISKIEFNPSYVPKIINADAYKDKINASDYFCAKNEKISCINKECDKLIFNDLRLTIEIIKYSCLFDYETCIFFYYRLYFRDNEYHYEYPDQANPKIEKEFRQNLMYNFDEKKHYFEPKLSKDIIRIDKLKSYHISKYEKLHIPGFDISIINQNRYVQFKESEKQIIREQVALSTNYKIKKI